MSTQTPNLNLDLREGTDIFNPLSTNANFETLDSVITEIRKKGGVPTYTTTASANLLKLSENPVPNETLFKFVAAGDANTWSYQETVNNIVTMDGNQKMIKGGEMYVAWVNAANAMVVVAWPDVVDAQTFDGKGPAEWASKAQLDAVNQTAVNATTTAQAAATVANNALTTAEAAGIKIDTLWENPNPSLSFNADSVTLSKPITDYKLYMVQARFDKTAAFQFYFVGIVSERRTNTPASLLCASSDYGSNVYGVARSFFFLNDTDIYFAAGNNVGGSGTASNDRAIPEKIFGIK